MFDSYFKMSGKLERFHSCSRKTFARPAIFFRPKSAFGMCISVVSLQTERSSRTFDGSNDSAPECRCIISDGSFAKPHQIQQNRKFKSHKLKTQLSSSCSSKLFFFKNHLSSEMLQVSWYSTQNFCHFFVVKILTKFSNPRCRTLKVRKVGIFPPYLRLATF